MAVQIKTIDGMVNALQRRFPEAWFRDGREMGFGDCIVTGEGAYVDDMKLYDYWGECESLYIFGVLKEVNDWVEARGWWFENYDAGTTCIYKKEQ